MDVELAFNVSIHLIGQQLPGASPPHLSFEFVLSDEADVVASGSFNGGNGAVVVGDQSAVVFKEDVLEGKSNVASLFVTKMRCLLSSITLLIFVDKVLFQTAFI